MQSNLNVYSKSHPAIQVLHKFQNFGFKSAILAGGSLRDVYHEKEIADYDVFLRFPHSLDNLEWPTKAPHLSEELFETILGKFVAYDNGDELYSSTADMDDGYVSKKNNRILAVWNLFRADDDQVFQFIFTNIDPVEYVNAHFDIGLCKIYCDGKKIHLSEDFMTDSNNHTLTICGKEMSRAEFDYTLDHHLPKMKTKYHGWKVLVSPENQEHVDEDNRHLL